jgi:probable HAF family extracellular repeat protein
MIDLGTFGGRGSDAYDINDSGTIVGWAQLSDATQHAFVYSNGVMTDLGESLGRGISSIATAINASGQIVGLGRNAFLYSNGVFTDLGSLGGGSSYAHDINASGHVVGSSTLTSDGNFNDTHAFIYRDGEIHNLNSLIDPSSQWTLINAKGINDRGQIVGWGWHDGYPRAYLLTPIPEPSTVALAAVGLIALAIYHRRSLTRSTA